MREVIPEPSYTGYYWVKRKDGEIILAHKHGRDDWSILACDDIIPWEWFEAIEVRPFEKPVF